MFEIFNETTSPYCLIQINFAFDRLPCIKVGLSLSTKVINILIYFVTVPQNQKSNKEKKQRSLRHYSNPNQCIWAPEGRGPKS